MKIDRPLRFGMIGGGRGAFVGNIHRIAAQMDGQAVLVAGAFSTDPERARLSGADLRLDPARVYGSYAEMARSESQRPPAERLDFVTIVTPTDSHAAIASLFLESGFNVICEKPLTSTLAEATELRSIVRRTHKVLAVTYNYSGHAMVQQARHMVSDGVLGDLRKVIVEYLQGWLAEPLELQGQKQAAWRMDPQLSGNAGCLSDIGIHAHHLMRHVTGLRIERLCADLTSLVPGRRVPDDATVLMHFEGGARGVLQCSQASLGEENNLGLRVYGTRASLEWHQEQPNELLLKHPDKPREVLRRGNGYNAPQNSSPGALPPGHPEGYLDAFACLYRQALAAIAAEVSGADFARLEYPDIDSGVDGVQFVEAGLRSARAGGTWVSI